MLISLFRLGHSLLYQGQPPATSRLRIKPAREGEARCAGFVVVLYRSRPRIAEVVIPVVVRPLSRYSTHAVRFIATVLGAPWWGESSRDFDVKSRLKHLGSVYTKRKLQVVCLCAISFSSSYCASGASLEPREGAQARRLDRSLERERGHSAAKARDGKASTAWSSKPGAEVGETLTIRYKSPGTSPGSPWRTPMRPSELRLLGHPVVGGRSRPCSDGHARATGPCHRGVFSHERGSP